MKTRCHFGEHFCLHKLFRKMQKITSNGYHALEFVMWNTRDSPSRYCPLLGLIWNMLTLYALPTTNLILTPWKQFIRFYSYMLRINYYVLVWLWLYDTFCDHPETWKTSIQRRNLLLIYKILNGIINSTYWIRKLNFHTCRRSRTRDLFSIKYTNYGNNETSPIFRFCFINAKLTPKYRLVHVLSQCENENGVAQLS